MKKLVRSNAPACLANLVSGRDGWESADKTQIWRLSTLCKVDFVHIVNANYPVSILNISKQELVILI